MPDHYARVLGFNLYVVHLLNATHTDKQLPLCLLEFEDWVAIVYHGREPVGQERQTEKNNVFYTHMHKLMLALH